MNDYQKARAAGLIRTDRWEERLDHHPMAERLVRFLSEHDLRDYGLHFDWRAGGDGDNGEALMYQMDPFFELLDKEKPK
jgi:hypothetical protein